MWLLVEVFDMALNSHVFIHLEQPVQLPLLMISACLCQGKFTRPNTLFEHASIHFQHASHFPVSSRIYLVFACLRLFRLVSISFFSKNTELEIVRTITKDNK
jgi:hypothetical protein